MQCLFCELSTIYSKLIMQTTVELRKLEPFGEAVLVAPEGKPPTLDFRVLSKLREVIDDVEEAVGQSGGAAPRCLVVTSSSERCFCAGANIGILDTLSEETMADWVAAGHEALNRLEDLPIPVIAKVRGYALGGGLELALACDLIVCDGTAKLGLTEANIGFVPGWGGSYRLPRRVGASRAKRMFYSSERVDAGSALSIGLVDEVVDGPELDRWIEDFSDGVSSKSLVGIRGFKSILNKQDRAARDANLLAETAHSLDCIQSADTKRRIKEFLDKRKS